MLSTTSPSSTIGQLDCDIAEAERLISNRVQSLRVALQKGAETMDLEARLRDMRRALELLYEQRRKLVSAMYLDKRLSRRGKGELSETAFLETYGFSSGCRCCACRAT